MKVFISWSGRRSHEVADTLAGWLKKVIQSAEPWVSTEMERGVKWLDVLGKSLDAHSAGILCVTTGNFKEPWLNFEAGALSKQIGDEVRVIPYLLDFRSLSELPPPLGQFNASLADEPGTRDLVKTLNAHSDPKLSDSDLEESFQVWWPKLDEKLQAIKASGSGQTPRRRSNDEKIDELLDLTRQLMRQASENISSREAATPRLGELMDLHADVRRSIAEERLTARRAKIMEIAARVVAEVLQAEGLNSRAMRVFKADDQGVLIFADTSVGADRTLRRKILRELDAALPGPPSVSFFREGRLLLNPDDDDPFDVST